MQFLLINEEIEKIYFKFFYTPQISFYKSGLHIAFGWSVA
jgi:hypothetical protein